MLSVVIVITIVVLSIILAAIGAYVVIHSTEEKEEPKPVIESAVETFKPTENEKPTEQAGDDMASIEIPEEPTDSAEEQPEGENNE